MHLARLETANRALIEPFCGSETRYLRPSQPETADVGVARSPRGTSRLHSSPSHGSLRTDRHSASSREVRTPTPRSHSTPRIQPGDECALAIPTQSSRRCNIAVQIIDVRTTQLPVDRCANSRNNETRQKSPNDHPVRPGRSQSDRQKEPGGVGDRAVANGLVGDYLLCIRFRTRGLTWSSRPLCSL